MVLCVESEEIDVPSIVFVSTVASWAKIMATFIISYYSGVFIVDNVNLMPHLLPIRSF